MADTGGLVWVLRFWRAAVLAVVCALIAFVIWFPFIKFYDNKLFVQEQSGTVQAD